jgi:ribonuclease P protein component
LKYSKDHRLLNAEDFRYVFENPRKIRGQAMDFYIRQNKNDEAVSRLGITVPKRCIKLAVMRNRIKRHLRETFRLNHVPLDGWDLIVMIKPGMTTVPSTDYGKVIETYWARLIEQCNGSKR